MTTVGPHSSPSVAAPGRPQATARGHRYHGVWAQRAQELRHTPIARPLITIACFVAATFALALCYGY